QLTGSDVPKRAEHHATDTGAANVVTPAWDAPRGRMRAREHLWARGHWSGSITARPSCAFSMMGESCNISSARGHQQTIRDGFRKSTALHSTCGLRSEASAEAQTETAVI